MTEIANESIALTVTSPPYWDAIDYNSHADCPEADYRTREGSAYEDYMSWLMKCFGEVFRVTKPSGFACVVIGTVLRKGAHYPLPFRFVMEMGRLGWCFHQDIVWYKVTGGVKRAGVNIMRPFPGYYYPNIMTEYILVFRKPGPEPIYKRRSAEEKEESGYDINDLYKKEIANNIWHIAPVPPRQYDHPCPFPEEIPFRLIRLYSFRGESVLDPFAGIGTTLKVAKHLGREYYGYEVVEKYYEAALERIETPLKLRDQLISRFEKTGEKEF
jgi:site-specific DNA-methyltransferase (adenine-specific)